MNADVFMVIYAEGDDEYQVLLRSEECAGFDAARMDPFIASRSGEDKVSALLRLYGSHIRHVHRYKNGVLNDSPDDEPAMLIYDADGGISLVEHWRDGQKIDDAASQRTPLMPAP